jgi:hypothetical protein
MVLVKVSPPETAGLDGLAAEQIADAESQHADTDNDRAGSVWMIDRARRYGLYFPLDRGGGVRRGLSDAFRFVRGLAGKACIELICHVGLLS